MFKIGAKNESSNKGNPADVKAATKTNKNRATEGERKYRLSNVSGQQLTITHFG